MIKLLLVDDHVLFRSGMRSILQAYADFQIMDDLGTGEAALEWLQTHRADVVLMDIGMPGMGGIEATRKIAQRHPSVHVIALTAMEDDPFPSRLLDAGAKGYLTKGCPAEEVVLAVRKVALGKHYVSHEVAQRLSISSLVRRGEGTPVDLLSAREMQVLLLISSGKSTQEMADTLFLSPKTISTYRSRMLEKLGLKNDVELTHFALRYGLVDLTALPNV